MKLNKLYFLLPLFILTSCNNRELNLNYEDFNKITPVEFFTQSEENYGVYFYNKTCNECEKIKDIILNFTNNIKNSTTSLENIYFLEATIVNLNQMSYYFEVYQDKNPSKENYNKVTIGVDNLNDFTYYGYPTLYILNKNAISSVYLGANSILQYINLNS